MLLRNTIKKIGVSLSKCKFVSLFLILSVLLINISVFAEFEWAKDAVSYCVDRKILQGMENGDLALSENITREQMAKILVDSFALSSNNDSNLFTDVDEDSWSYSYIYAFKDYMKKNWAKFNPKEMVTREEFAASLVLASGLKESSLKNKNILTNHYLDANKVDADYTKLLSVAVERAYYLGSNKKLRPKDLLTRAEACSLLYRVLAAKEGKITLELNFSDECTSMVGEAQVTLEQAKAWAKTRGAHQRYIDIADLYWKYGELTGIRPELLYAQAAKETAFGKYGGAVLPEQNNWAGIKIKSPTGDATYDHETFETADDGVRAHFNHICAYIGLEPIGTPHDRYYVVLTTKNAGKVKNIEDLGGKWCPDLYYGYSIMIDYVDQMRKAK